MSKLILHAIGFYVGGGVACYLFGCFLGLSFLTNRAGPTARAGTTTLRVLGFVHPVAAVVGQDLVRFKHQCDPPAAVGSESVAAAPELRLDVALVVSLALCVGVVAVLWNSA